MAKQIIQKNNSTVQDNQQINVTLEESSDIIIYDSFGILSAKKSIWVPEAQKSILLTAVEVSAPLDISIILSDGDNNFLSLRVTELLSTVSQRFSSAYRLKTNNALMVSTSDETIKCNTSGAVSATQVAYNSRSDFVNVNNAVGLANGSLAVLSSGLLNQTRGRINLGYSMLPSNYTYLEITSVVIKYYCRLSLTLAVGVSSMILYWRPNSQENWTELQQMSLSLIGAIDYLTVPVTYDITNAILQASNPWEVISNMQTSFVGTHTGLGLGNAVQLDAVEVEICMSGKNQITLLGYEV
ncbi:hypothetical protein [Lacrimispora sp.]|uniref:hypothetical protein n=1 Tax=Lacrimispora sp. TaxID=2719234 RepID=UPI00345FC485